MRVHGAKYVLALAAGAGLAFAGGSQAAGHRQIGCAPGHVRRSVRVPERRHGRIVHRHGRIVYVRVQRCVKVKAQTQAGAHADVACDHDDGGRSGPATAASAHGDDDHHGDDSGGYDHHHVYHGDRHHVDNDDHDPAATSAGL